MDIKEFDQLLERHDWHYTSSDDISVFRRGKAAEEKLDQLAQTSPQHDLLYRAYKTYQYKSGSERTAEQVLALQMARVSSGATTKEELDRLAQEKREREQQEVERQRQMLARFDKTCGSHNWFYWRADWSSRQYQEGLKERVILTKQLPIVSSYAAVLQDPQHHYYPYLKLFLAWAKFYNFSRSKAHLAELHAARKELGLLED